MIVEIVEDWDAFQALRPHWQRLHARDPESGYFLSWRWLAEVFRANPGRWKVLVARSDASNGEVTGLLPLKHRVRWSESGQQFKTELGPGGKLSWAQYTGMICEPERERAVTGAFADTLLQTPWARIGFLHDGCRRRLDMLLERFPEKMYRLTERSQMINGGEVDNLICPQVPLPDSFERYLAECVSSNTRQKIRRFWRRFEADETLTITDSSPATFDGDLDALLDMWRVSWTPVRGEKSVERAISKYRDVIAQSHRLDAVNLCTLWRADKRLGALCSFVDRVSKHLYFIVAGRDETVSDPNIGLLLHTHNIKWAVANGMDIYDFCHGNEAYKFSYGAEAKQLTYLEISRRSACNVARLDPDHLGEAMRKTIAMLEADRTEAAKNACRQILPLIA
ncbi:MAG: GNAT family N-acetyltransferase [Rhizobiaceae bacterium]